jgi:SPP1 gp7 family putative phage head morphogenesis protein
MAKPKLSQEYIDAMVRHQIYLEGYKAYQGAQFEATAKLIEADFKKAINGLDVETLDELTKAKLLSFIATLRKTNLKHFAKYNDKVLDDLEKFVTVDFGVIAEVFDDKPLPVPTGLFKRIMGEPIAAIGQFAGNLLKTIGNAMIVKSERVITQAWGEGWTKADTLKELVGEKIRMTIKPASVGTSTKVKGGDGLQTVTTDDTLDRKPPAAIPDAPKGKVSIPTAVVEPPSVGGVVNGARQDNQSAISTALQHLSTGVKETVIKKYAKYYSWVSVIDSRTTAICTQRDGTVYEMGEGPLPPAHIRCRSTIAPWDGTYYKSEFEDKDPEANIG